MKNSPSILLFLLIVFCSHVMADNNLIPNPNFNDPVNPLATWRINFPWEDEWYATNGKYIKSTNQLGRSCALLDVPGAIAGNQGAKIESAFVKLEPGVTKYHVEVDCLPGNMAMKFFAEAWTTDPKPEIKVDKWRVPAAADHPPLVNCYRAQLPDPKGNPNQWITVKRDFTLHSPVIVLGKPQVPEYMTFKVFVFNGGTDGKAYVTNCRITKSD